MENIEYLKKNPQFTINIIKLIEDSIRRKLNNSEENIVIKYVKNISENVFKQNSLETIINHIKNLVISDISKELANKNDVNIHGLLTSRIDPNTEHKTSINNNNIDIKSAFGYCDLDELLKKIHKPITLYNAYLLLDSRYRNLDNDGLDYFSWTHINNFLRNQGTINSIGDIKDIKSISISPYRIPYHESAITPYNRITLNINEFFVQSVVAHEKRTFHFTGVPSIDDTLNPKWIDINTTEFNKGKMKFNKHITTLDTITLSFGTPLEKINFDKDRLNGVFTYGSPTIITFDEAHNLKDNDIIYISTFTTLNTQANSILINDFNNTTGIKCSIISNLSISIPINSSSLIPETGTVTSPFLVIPPTSTVTITKSNNMISGNATNFTTIFKVGEYIQINNGNSNPFYKIVNIVSDILLQIESNYTYNFGTFTFNKTSDIVTTSLTSLQIGDNLIINNTNYTVFYINGNNITLDRPFDGIESVLQHDCVKNNTINTPYMIFFGSKRIFINLKIEYTV